MGFVLKKRFTGVAAAVCLLILTLLPAGAFAESVTFDYGMDKSYNNGRLLWDGDKLTSTLARCLMRSFLI